jgi:hypothetical protein
MFTPSPKIKIEVAEVYQDRVPVDEDIEFADMCNPRGFIYGTLWFVRATAANGERFLHDHRFDDMEEAQDLCHRVNGRKEINEVHWTRTYPEYGSAAWGVEDAHRQVDLACALHRGDMEAVDRLA